MMSLQTVEVKDEKVYTSITKTCRVCFVQDENLTFLYGTSPNGTPRDNLIMCTKISISIDDGGPNYICDLCLDQLNIVVSFLKKFSDTDAEWKSMMLDLHENSDSEKMIDTDMDYTSPNFKEEISDDVKLKTTQPFEEKRKDMTHLSESIVEYVTHYRNYSTVKRKSVSLNVTSSNKDDFKKMKKSRKTYKSLHTYKEDLKYKCIQCPKSFSSKRYLTKHLHAHSGCKEHTCELCGKQFKYNDNLKAHRTNVHESERPYPCDLCSKKFPKKDNLTVHRKRHLQQREHCCEVCGAAYYTAYELQTHAHSHAGHKPHACHLCEKRFTAKNNLHIHHRTHTGEKPHGCNTCGKKFISSNILLIHKRIHTGEKPYVCSVCGAQFAANKLAVHMRIHTGEKPHVCTLCGKQFASGNALSIHMRHHTGEKPYSCQLCARTYAHTQSLNKHLRRHHKLHTNPTHLPQPLKSEESTVLSSAGPHETNTIQCINVPPLSSQRTTDHKSTSSSLKHQQILTAL